MSDLHPFSERFAHFRAEPITVCDEAPPRLRAFVNDAMRHFYPYDDLALNLTCLCIGKVPIHPQIRYGGNVWQYVLMEIEAAQWFRIYDLIEGIFNKLEATGARSRAHFQKLTNTFFERNGYAYKLTSSGLVEYRGEESFEIATATATSVLQVAGLNTARSEIHAALEDLSKRPMPDLTGAVQHAMAGLECAAKDVTLEPKLELGKILKRNDHLFPVPLGEALTLLYGYSSNNGRHLLEGQEPRFEEVELIVGIASTAATYLARKKMMST